jgi:MobA/MobL family
MSDFFGFRLGVVQRSKGQTAAERSAYQRRGAARLGNASVVDYSDREDHVGHFVLAPKDAPAWATDYEKLWMRAAAAEKRADAQEARTIEISFPRALVRQDWIELAHRLGRFLVRCGMVVQIDIHCPLACDGLPNPHAHVLATMREIDDSGFAKLKARHWNRLFHGKASALRRDWARILNKYCRQRGIAYHADHRSNAERGLSSAEVRLHRWNVLCYKRTGQKTEALEKRDRERTARAEIARLEAECKKAERELEAARADLEPAPSANQRLAMPIKQRLSFPTRNIAPAKSHGVRAEELGATAVLPHRSIRRDDDAVISKIFGNLDRLPQPDAAQAAPPLPPVGLAENVRHAVTKNGGRRLACRLLREHVSRDNPYHQQNLQHLLGLCSSELTKAIILFLAEKDADREFDETDLPFEMIELQHWTPQERFNFEMDLRLMTVRASGWGLMPPSSHHIPPLAIPDPTSRI